MAVEGGLGFCLDESIGVALAATLCSLRAPAAPRIHGLKDLDLHGTSDEVWIATLRRREIHAVVTRDSSILRSTVRRDVWRGAGLSLFILDGKWGNLPLFELARGLIWCWPTIVATAQSGPQGGAWQVPAETCRPELRRLFADPDLPPAT